MKVDFYCIHSLEGISPGINDGHLRGLAVGISHLKKVIRYMRMRLEQV